MSQGGGNFQDWKPVVFHKNPAKLPIAEQKRQGLVTTVRDPKGGNNNNTQGATINYDEEGNEVVKIHEIDPGFSINNYAIVMSYKNQADTDRILNALKKAGLK